MGFFSCLCKGCHHPLLSPMAIEKKNGWMCDAVVLQKNGTRIIGEYDGYGRVNDVDCFDYGDPVAYHHACWVALGKPEYDGKPSPGANDQGWFFSDNVHNEEKPVTKGDVSALNKKEKARLKIESAQAKIAYKQYLEKKAV